MKTPSRSQLQLYRPESIVPQPRGSLGSSQTLGRWLLVFLALGIVWRLTRYFLRFPVWGDECFICLNMVDQTYLGLTGPLRCSQVAPVLFLWGEFTAFLTLGSSEMALRLLPMLAGLTGLFLFWHLATLLLQPLARTLAVGFLAVAIWPVSMCSLIKPYSLDLCMATAMLVLAVHWLRNPEQQRWLWYLSLLTPVALFASYPAVFIAGSVSLALLPAAWKSPSARIRLAFLAYNIVLFASFLANYYVVGLSQLDRQHGTVNAYLLDYWADGFPPRHPLEFLQWFFLTHVGQLFAYPIGGSNGLSTVTTVVFLLGIHAVWRSRQSDLLVLSLTPFVLGLVAAFLHKYPYGASGRLSQHVAPIICLLAGVGTAWVIERFASPLWRSRATLVVCGWFVAVAIVGIQADLIRPYRGEGDLWVDRIVHQIHSLSGPNDQIIVLEREENVQVVFRWELARHQLQGGYVGYDGQVNSELLAGKSTQIWVLNLGEDPSGLDRVRNTLQQSGRTWTLASQVPYTLIPSRKKEPPQHCTVVRWVSPGTTETPSPLPPLSVWP